MEWNAWKDLPEMQEHRDAGISPLFGPSLRRAQARSPSQRCPFVVNRRGKVPTTGGR